MEFTSLAFNPLSRMNEIIRYSSVYQETEETLAEHITEVSTMTYLMLRYIQKETNGEEKFDLGSLLEKCLLHDADEVLTGDIPRNTKYATSEAHENLNKVAEEALDLIEKTIGFSIKPVWESSKCGKEGLLLKIADMLVVVKKAITEIELRGNLTFLKVVSELETHLENTVNNLDLVDLFQCEFTVQYLTNLVKQAKDEITTIRVKYNHVMSKYKIYENVIKGE